MEIEIEEKSNKNKSQSNLVDLPDIHNVLPK